MSRFFAKPVQGAAILSKEDAHHLTRVLRAQIGDRIEIAWEGQAWQGTLESVEPAVVRLQEELPSAEPDLSIVLVQALAKSDKMDWIVQKAVELGVDRVLPVRTRYSDVRLDESRAEKKREHWQKVSEAAAKQSGRSRIPEVQKPAGLAEAVAQLPGYRMLVFHEKADSQLRFEKAEPTAVFIGPEGGFSEEEIALLAASGAEICRLGPRILRTETAGPAAIAIIQYETGDLNDEISD